MCSKAQKVMLYSRLGKDRKVRKAPKSSENIQNIQKVDPKYPKGRSKNRSFQRCATKLVLVVASFTLFCCPRTTATLISTNIGRNKSQKADLRSTCNKLMASEQPSLQFNIRRTPKHTEVRYATEFGQAQGK